jgi:hypothetical protein
MAMSDHVTCADVVDVERDGTLKVRRASWAGAGFQLPDSHAQLLMVTACHFVPSREGGSAPHSL